MKQLLTLAGFVCLIAMLLPACAPPPEPEPEPAPEPVFDQAAEEAAIRAFWEQRQALINQHDVKALSAQLDEAFENWEGTSKGRAAYEKSRTEWFDRADFQITMFDEIGIVFVTPDVAIYKFRQEIKGNVDSDGKPLPPYKNLRALVLVKKGGEWLYIAGFGRQIEQ